MQGRISVSQILCDIFVRNLFGVFKELHGYMLGWACRAFTSGGGGGGQ